MSELKGTVVLDKASQEALETELREKIVKDMKTTGFMHADMRNYLKTLDYDEFVDLIGESIDDVVYRMQGKLNNPMHRDKIIEDKQISQILAIQSVLKI